MFEKFFSATYADARQSFLAAARTGGHAVRSFVNPVGPGVDGEELAIDAAYVGPEDARALLMLSSGTHGAEGYCGSGCQIALLHDEALMRKAGDAGIGILLVHALNPYGFSYGHRTNEDNIDLNRNFCDYARPLPANAHYADLHPVLLTEAWPPGPDNEAAIQDFIRTRGERAYGEAVMKGQHTHADGLFYGGVAPAWSNRVLRQICREYGRGRERMAWIDYHTGLGPYGHAEKIFVQPPGADYERALRWWGLDLVPIFGAESSTVDIAGTLVQAMLEECTDVPQRTFLALEYGTRPLAEVLMALRGDRWLESHPQADPELRRQLKAVHRATFYPDHDDWRGAVIGQSRATLLQTLNGLTD
ncbi:M14 family metallopeptidase [Candidimonas humi]|uniref:M14 family metallopeptidase n=1 Tax=Candidimonas humi TaxID=683355 RepID=A0ABV8P3B4_9BURK|nr:M14 family metallopeptidase [Candidimonas humi]MBV6305343.1 M14 family metallopeptidase [Candidimonas humi]